MLCSYRVGSQECAWANRRWHSVDGVPAGVYVQRTFSGLRVIRVVKRVKIHQPLAKQPCALVVLLVSEEQPRQHVPRNINLQTGYAILNPICRYFTRLRVPLSQSALERVLVKSLHIYPADRPRYGSVPVTNYIIDI